MELSVERRIKFLVRLSISQLRNKELDPEEIYQRLFEMPLISTSLDIDGTLVDIHFFILPVYRCDHCKNSTYLNGPYSSCGRCSQVRYCSDECQKNGWKDHKPLCSPIVDNDLITVSKNLIDIITKELPDDLIDPLMNALNNNVTINVINSNSPLTINEMTLSKEEAEAVLTKRSFVNNFIPLSADNNYELDEDTVIPSSKFRLVVTEGEDTVVRDFVIINTNVKFVSKNDM